MEILVISFINFSILGSSVYRKLKKVLKILEAFDKKLKSLSYNELVL